MKTRIQAFADDFNFTVQIYEKDNVIKIEGTEFLRTIDMARDDSLLKDVERKRNGNIYFTPLSLIKTLVIRKTALCDEMLLSLWQVPDESSMINDAIQREYEATDRADKMEELATTFAKYVRVSNKMTEELERSASDLLLDTCDDDDDDIKRQAAIDKIKFQAILKEKKKKRSDALVVKKTSIENGIPVYSLVRDPNFTGPLQYYALHAPCIRAQREMSIAFDAGKIPLDYFSYSHVWVEDIEISEAKANVANLLFKNRVTYEDVLEFLASLNELRD